MKDHKLLDAKSSQFLILFVPVFRSLKKDLSSYEAIKNDFHEPRAIAQVERAMNLVEKHWTGTGSRIRFAR